MARKNATEDTEVMFPELDDSPAHKALLKQARKAAKSKAARHALLTDAKAEEDADNQKLVALLHENKINAFKHGEVKVKLASTKEKAIVTIGDDEEKEEPGND